MPVTEISYIAAAAPVLSGGTFQEMEIRMSNQLATGFIGGCVFAAVMAISFNAAGKKPGIEIELSASEAAMLRFCSADPTPVFKALEEGIHLMERGNPHPIVKPQGLGHIVASAGSPCFRFDYHYNQTYNPNRDMYTPR